MKYTFDKTFRLLSAGATFYASVVIEPDFSDTNYIIILPGALNSSNTKLEPKVRGPRRLDVDEKSEKSSS